MSDRAVRKAIDTGACDLDSVAARCGAGARCGGCHPALMSLLAGIDRLTSAGA